MIKKFQIGDKYIWKYNGGYFEINYKVITESDRNAFEQLMAEEDEQVKKFEEKRKLETEEFRKNIQERWNNAFGSDIPINIKDARDLGLYFSEGMFDENDAIIENELTCKIRKCFRE